MAVNHKRISILQEEPGCSYKTCRKTNPSRQHSSRRHSDIPYIRRVNGKVIKFTRSGNEGDEERPFKCCCGKEYQNTRSLADHLAAGCEIFENEVKRDAYGLLDRSSSDAVPISNNDSREHTLISKSALQELTGRLEQMNGRIEFLEQHYKECHNHHYNHYQDNSVSTPGGSGHYMEHYPSCSNVTSDSHSHHSNIHSNSSGYYDERDDGHRQHGYLTEYHSYDGGNGQYGGGGYAPPVPQYEMHDQVPRISPPSSSSSTSSGYYDHHHYHHRYAQ